MPTTTFLGAGRPGWAEVPSDAYNGWELGLQLAIGLGAASETFLQMSALVCAQGVTCQCRRLSMLADVAAR